MTPNSKNLRDRSRAAFELVKETRPVVAEFGLSIDDRTAVAIPLVLASMDVAEAIYTLLETRPEEHWAAALIMQRSQMEYVLRAAFFAKAASQKELTNFRRRGVMPSRAKRGIYISEVAEEASHHLNWDKSKLVTTVKNHQRDLSGVVHGGKEVLAIYTMHSEAWGDLTVDWDQLIDHVNNIAVFVQLALSVAMSLSRLDPIELDVIVRPAFEKAVSFFSEC